jgi:RNA polymerase sigma-70 factor (ECF subfamily)
MAPARLCPSRTSKARRRAPRAIPAAPPLTPEGVFREHGPRVYNVARRILGNDADAEDVMQDVLLQVVRRLDTFRNEARFTTWLHSVTVNAALLHRRKAARRREHQAGAPLDYFPVPCGRLPELPGPERLALAREQQGLIEQAIAGLPPLYRDVYVLADVEGMANAEVGELLGQSLPAVKSRLHRARLALRAALAHHFPERCGQRAPRTQG